MPANGLYHTWFDRIRQLCPEARKSLVHNFTWLLIGIYLTRKVHLSLIANKIPGRAKLNSKVQRLRRLLMGSISVRKWYDPLAEELLQSQAQHGHIRLIVDGTRVSFHHQLLMVSLAYRRCAIPIAWTWVKGKRGHSSSAKQLALLKHIYKLIPKDTSVSLVGDSEFGAVALLRQLDDWKWQYALRQKGNTLVDLFSRRVVGWSMASTMHGSLVRNALQMALTGRRPPAGLLHHSDQGSQYASFVYQSLLDDQQMVVSMSRTANCYHNAAMESFFATLKCELVHERHYRSRAEARADIFEYIEVFYNRQRLHSSLGYLSPEEYEQLRQVCIS